jgi:hypothetical protein
MDQQESNGSAEDNRQSKLQLLALSLLQRSYVLRILNIRWNVAAGVISIDWMLGELNIADATNKRLPEIKRDKLFGDWTY